MRVVIRADNGDEVTVTADELGVEQATITIEVESRSFPGAMEQDSITFSLDQARNLARALIGAVEMTESMRNFATMTAIPSPEASGFRM
jgi:hypothetical protein